MNNVLLNNFLHLQEKTKLKIILTRKKIVNAKAVRIPKAKVIKKIELIKKLTK